MFDKWIAYVGFRDIAESLTMDTSQRTVVALMGKSQVSFFHMLEKILAGYCLVYQYPWVARSGESTELLQNYILPTKIKSRLASSISTNTEEEVAERRAQNQARNRTAKTQDDKKDGDDKTGKSKNKVKNIWHLLRSQEQTHRRHDFTVPHPRPTGKHVTLRRSNSRDGSSTRLKTRSWDTDFGNSTFRSIYFLHMLIMTTRYAPQRISCHWRVSWKRCGYLVLWEN